MISYRKAASRKGLRLIVSAILSTLLLTSCTPWLRDSCQDADMQLKHIHQMQAEGRITPSDATKLTAIWLAHYQARSAEGCP